MANSEWRVANSFGGQCFCTAEKFSASGDVLSSFANLKARAPARPKVDKSGGRGYCRAKTAANGEWRIANGERQVANGE